MDEPAQDNDSAQTQSAHSLTVAPDSEDERSEEQPWHAASWRLGSSQHPPPGVTAVRDGGAPGPSTRSSMQERLEGGEVAGVPIPDLDTENSNHRKRVREMSGQTEPGWARYNGNTHGNGSSYENAILLGTQEEGVGQPSVRRGREGKDKEGGKGKAEVAGDEDMEECSAPRVEPPSDMEVGTCSICMEAWTDGGQHRVSSLLCGHVFGLSCIDRWLRQGRRRQGKCPQCNEKAKVVDIRPLFLSRAVGVLPCAEPSGLEQAQAQEDLMAEVFTLRHENSELKAENLSLKEQLKELKTLLAAIGEEQTAAFNSFRGRSWGGRGGGRLDHQTSTFVRGGGLGSGRHGVRPNHALPNHALSWELARASGGVGPSYVHMSRPGSSGAVQTWRPNAEPRLDFPDQRRSTQHPMSQEHGTSRQAVAEPALVPRGETSGASAGQGPVVVCTTILPACQEGREGSGGGAAPVRPPRVQRRLMEGEGWCDSGSGSGRENPGGFGAGVGVRAVRQLSSLASIGRRGLEGTFTLLGALPVSGARVMEMDAHSHTLLVSQSHMHTHAMAGHDASLHKVSLFVLSAGERVPLPSGMGAIRDVKIAPPPMTSAFGGPLCRTALVASTARSLTAVSLSSNQVVASLALPVPAWACCWDSLDSSIAYAGLQNGQLIVFDLRQPGSHLAVLHGGGPQPIHTIHFVPPDASCVSPTGTGRQSGDILVASCSGVYSWPLQGVTRPAPLGELASASSSSSSSCAPEPCSTATRVPDLYPHGRVCTSLAFDAQSASAVVSLRARQRLSSSGAEPSSSSGPRETSTQDLSQSERSSHVAESLGGATYSAQPPANDVAGTSSHQAHPRDPETEEPAIHHILRRGMASSPANLEARAQVEGESVRQLLGSSQATESFQRWVWDRGPGMGGHKSLLMRPRSTIVPEWTPGGTSQLAAGQSSSGSSAPLFAFGDEETNSLWLWDMMSKEVVQKLNPHSTAIVDAKHARGEGSPMEGDLLASLSSTTVHLYRRRLG